MVDHPYARHSEMADDSEIIRGQTYKSPNRKIANWVISASVPELGFGTALAHAGKESAGAGTDGSDAVEHGVGNSPGVIGFAFPYLEPSPVVANAFPAVDRSDSHGI